MSNAGSTGSFFSGHAYGDGTNSTSGANTRTHYTDTRRSRAKPRRKKKKKVETRRREPVESYFANKSGKYMRPTIGSGSGIVKG